MLYKFPPVRFSGFPFRYGWWVLCHAPRNVSKPNRGAAEPQPPHFGATSDAVRLASAPIGKVGESHTDVESDPAHIYGFLTKLPGARVVNGSLLDRYFSSCLKMSREKPLDIFDHSFDLVFGEVLGLAMSGAISNCRQCGDSLFLSCAICAGLSQVFVHLVDAALT